MMSIFKTLGRLCVTICLAVLSGCAVSADSSTSSGTNQQVEPARRIIELHAGDRMPVDIKPDEIIVIEMVSNPSTGYKWDATQLTREKRCYLLNEIEIASPRTPTEGQPLAGAPIKQRWTLRHDPQFPCPSEQPVTWTYRRSWEPFNHSDQQATILLQSVTLSLQQLKNQP